MIKAIGTWDLCIAAVGIWLAWINIADGNPVLGLVSAVLGGMLLIMGGALLWKR